MLLCNLDLHIELDLIRKHSEMIEINFKTTVRVCRHFICMENVENTNIILQK